MHAKTWFPSNEMHESPNLTNEPLWKIRLVFRIYDKAGNGYIPITALKEILRELDSKLTDEELDGIIEEIDEDGSGTVDFDEFMEMMTG